VLASTSKPSQLLFAPEARKTELYAVQRLLQRRKTLLFELERCGVSDKEVDIDYQDERDVG
jgi:hypothetical protein